MGVPAPPYAPETLKTVAQFGGPVAVTTGSTSAAVTFGTAFPDATYMMDLEWVSGPPPTQGYATIGKTVSNCILAFYGTISNSAFKWQAWRLV